MVDLEDGDVAQLRDEPVGTRVEACPEDDQLLGALDRMNDKSFIKQHTPASAYR